MKALLVDYSLTGNNRRLADHLAERLSADRESIEVLRSMSNGAIALDRLFGRAPKIAENTRQPADYDLVVLLGPVWMGKIASPLRTYIRRHRGGFRQVAFVSLSGGALGPNKNVEKEIADRTGLPPRLVHQFYTNDLIPEEEKKKMSRTSVYQLTADDLAGPLKGGIEELVSRLHTTA